MSKLWRLVSKRTEHKACYTICHLWIYFPNGWFKALVHIQQFITINSSYCSPAVLWVVLIEMLFLSHPSLSLNFPAHDLEEREYDTTSFIRGIQQSVLSYQHWFLRCKVSDEWLIIAVSSITVLLIYSPASSLRLTHRNPIQLLVNYT